VAEERPVSDRNNERPSATRTNPFYPCLIEDFFEGWFPVPLARFIHYRFWYSLNVGHWPVETYLASRIGLGWFTGYYSFFSDWLIVGNVTFGDYPQFWGGGQSPAML
jgi:hypothetical protein